MRNWPSWRRRLAAFAAIFGLLASGLTPLAQARAASSAGTTLLAAICSPNGVRFVEIDLGGNADSPRAPLTDGLDHCPGCFAGAAPALLPVAVAEVPPGAADRVVPGSGDDIPVRPAGTSFRARAPPFAS